MRYVLYDQAGTSEKTFQGGLRRDDDPARQGKVSGGLGSAVVLVLLSFD